MSAYIRWFNSSDDQTWNLMYETEINSFRTCVIYNNFVQFPYSLNE